MRQKGRITAPCRHREALGQPQNGVVVGVCNLCGNRREYPAELRERTWGHADIDYAKAVRKAVRQERQQMKPWGDEDE